MNISFSPPKARIVAVLIAAWMLWRLLRQYTIEFSVDLHLPPLEIIHLIGALVIIGIIIVGLFRLYLDNR